MIRTRQLQLTSTPQEVVIPGGLSSAVYARLDFDSYPSAGTVTIELKTSYDGAWQSIQNGTELSVTSGPVECKFDGGVVLLRVTFTGLSGGASPVLTLVENQTAVPPSFLMTDGGFGESARIRVDNGQTGFFARRMWSIGYEFPSANPIAATPLVFRLIIPTNFIIHAHSLAVDQGGVTLRTYRETQGTPGGTFDPYVLQTENGMDEKPAYQFQALAALGGTFVATAGQEPITALRVRTSGATAQQSSVNGSVVSEKGRPAGTYYAVLSRMTGVSGNCTGVYNLVVEERP